MNKFYVEEGNKRVSVMKFFDAVSIPGEVIRIIPRPTEEKENKIYYEFLDFYKAAPLGELVGSRMLSTVFLSWLGSILSSIS